MISFEVYLKKVHESILIGKDPGNTVSSLSEDLLASIRLIEKIREDNKNIYIIGNGGSAAIASHVQNDLCKGAGVRAMVFHETPLLTAYSNDISYEDAYAESLKLWAEPRDLLIAISSSGRSKNILNAVRVAKKMGGSVITLSGFSHDNPLRRMGDINIYVQSDEYGIVETAHATILHYITDAVKHES
jgi:D-sedoheptulose 7-phosphate isomerase